jgi:hypothetical protein
MVVNIYQTISYTYGSDLCPKHLFISDLCFRPYGWRPMAMPQTPIHLRPLWLETYVSNTYGWSPMSRTPMAGALCLRPLAWNYVAFPIQ